MVSRFFVLPLLEPSDNAKDTAFLIEGIMQACLKVVSKFASVTNGQHSHAVVKFLDDARAAATRAAAGQLPDFSTVGLNSAWCPTRRD